MCKATNLYIGKSIHPLESQCFKIGISHDNTRRAYTLHMTICNSYAFPNKKSSLMAEKKALKHMQDLGYKRAFVKYNPSELTARPNRTWDWFFVPHGEEAQFLHDINTLVSGLHRVAWLWEEGQDVS